MNEYLNSALVAVIVFASNALHSTELDQQDGLQS